MRQGFQRLKNFRILSNPGRIMHKIRAGALPIRTGPGHASGHQESSKSAAVNGQALARQAAANKAGPGDKVWNFRGLKCYIM